MANSKAISRPVRFGQLDFAPRVEDGEMVPVAGVCAAADLACGIDNAAIGYLQSLGQPSKLRPRPLLDIGIEARLLWEMWQARKAV